SHHDRIRINNVNIDDQRLLDYINQTKVYWDTYDLNMFDIDMMIASLFFRDENVDFAIFEVGMGGRLDSTNIINPLACLITNISFDHTQFLGNSLEKIAEEKAGIIKQNTPVVISQTQNETQNVFLAKANEKNAPICFADSYLSCENVSHSQGLLKMDIYQNKAERLNNLQSSLSGYYQQRNILGVIALIDTLNKYHNFNISDEEIIEGIKNISSNFPIAGRWQTLCKKPLTICDTGHNEDGLKYVIEQIKNTPHKKLRFVLAMVNDKDVNKVLSMLDKEAEYYLSQAKIPRALPVNELAEKAKQAGLSFTQYETISQALAKAQEEAEENDLVFVGGSTFTVAEVV
ncbi:MAG: Mur ligase family protein, partial [Bacteroidales bacterium]|nr:Mur ligase family protein [Bacteroidales bacterium]